MHQQRWFQNGITPDVADLWRADLTLDLKFAHHAVTNDLEMEFAHALDYSLTRLLVTRKPERWVLSGELDQRIGHLQTTQRKHSIGRVCETVRRGKSNSDAYGCSG